MPLEKPGSVTGAAVLGYLQAGLTLITTVLLFAGLAGSPDNTAGVAEGWILAIAQLVGIILLIFGAVQLMSGSGRGLFISAVTLELAICLYWLIRIAAKDTSGLQIARNAKSAAIVFPIAFALLPVIALILVLGGNTGRWLQAKRNR